MNPRSKKFAKSTTALAVTLLVAACGGGGNDLDRVPASDGVAPTLAIDDNIAGPVATRAVTFVFTFSESVGNSFTASDVLVDGGTAGALIKVNDGKYLLEVTPRPNSSGMLSVRVPAGAFTDAGGTASVLAAQHEQAFDTVPVVPPPVSGDIVLASFDEATPLQFEGFNGAETSSIATGPAGGTGKAGKIVRLGGEVWAGAKVNVGPIALTASNRTITARVFSPAAGIPMVLKLEAAENPGTVNTGDLQSVETVVAGWQTLTWVVPADKVGPEYVWVVMLPNLNTRASTDPGETYFFDDIRLEPGP